MALAPLRYSPISGNHYSVTSVCVPPETRDETKGLNDTLERLGDKVVAVFQENKEWRGHPKMDDFGGYHYYTQPCMYRVIYRTDPLPLENIQTSGIFGDICNGDKP